MDRIANAEKAPLTILVETSGTGVTNRQTCKVCGRPDKFDFYVPDEVWAAVVPEEFGHLALCLYCFDNFAAGRQVNYATCLSELWFAGDAATFRFAVAAAIPSS